MGAGVGEIMEKFKCDRAHCMDPHWLHEEPPKNICFLLQDPPSWVSRADNPRLSAIWAWLHTPGPGWALEEEYLRFYAKAQKHLCARALVTTWANHGHQTFWGEPWLLLLAGSMSQLTVCAGLMQGSCNLLCISHWPTGSFLAQAPSRSDESIFHVLCSTQI